MASNWNGLRVPGCQPETRRVNKNRPDSIAVFVVISTPNERPSNVVSRMTPPCWVFRTTTRAWRSTRAPDKLVARTRRRNIIVEKQREAEGIISPRSQREAAATGLETLVGEFAADLAARGRSDAHQNDTVKRVRRIIAETGWHRLGDIRADQFVKWRASLTCSAKTAKEYQAAINNFLNWLARLDRIAVNPLAKVPQVATRGKQVRLARAFTPAELGALFAVSPARTLVYQTLAYTGQRAGEVRALRWGDLHLDGERPHALFREETMKDDKKRALPLHPSLAAALLAARPAGVAPGRLVFARFPKWRTLLANFARLNIARKDETGRVVHFHSFRKTFQTLGVNAGINQRAAPEMLGHTDANLTAKVYTERARAPTALGDRENSVDFGRKDRRTSLLTNRPKNGLFLARGRHLRRRAFACARYAITGA